MGSILGNRVTRVEDPRFLTTGGRYVDDIRLDDVDNDDIAHVAYVRSPYAHAVITSIELDDALDVPGVLRIFTAADLEGHVGAFPASRPGLPAAMGQVILASDRVRYVGQAVCAVVAETAAAAVDAVDLVFVDYEPLPVVVDPEVSARDETLLYPDAGSNAVLAIASPQRADFGGC
jgi:carbon-monoxide dehydrogenase large subunit